MICWPEETDMSKSKAKKSEIKIIQEHRPYVLWRRVSTTEQGESGLGLAAQVAIAETFMGRPAVEVFTDVHTGTKLRQCEALWKAIDFCKAQNYVLVIAKTDRCRNAQEALEILDAIGERNLIFCDLPSCDRFILTVMFAMHERTAQIGRINTRIALAERKKQIEQDGGFISKSGNFCDHLGRQKGEKNPNAVAAMGAQITANAAEWRNDSGLYAWVTIQLLKGRTQKDILEESAVLYEKAPDKYSTRQGKKLCKGTLSRWTKEILRKG